MEYKHNELYFLPLGGSGEIGMNMNLYHYQGKWIMVDCGVTFDDELGIDVIMPDPTYIEERKQDLEGIVLTHGHEDHIGALPYLWERFKCPIYATPFTAALVRAKLKDAGLLQALNLVVVPIGSEIQLGPFDIEFVHLTHSIPEPNALAIKTTAGTVVHTGDWKLDPNPMVGQATDTDRLKAIGDLGVLALTCDSTNVFVEGRTESEGDVRTSLVDIVKEQKGRVAIGLFASNVARLETCAVAAAESGRTAVLVGRSLNRVYQAARESGYLLDVPEFIDMNEAAGMPKDKVLLLCTGSQGEPRAALTRIANGTHPNIRLEEGDTVIFSSRKIPGNEMAIASLQNRLQSNGIEVIADSDAFIHVSGHPAREELLDMYKLIRPEIIVPVHGEQIHMHEQAALARDHGIPKAVVPYNGSVIRLSNGPEIVDEVHSGRLGLDGNRVVPLFSPHILDRDRIMREGIAFATVVVGKNNTMAEPILSFVGLAASIDEEELLHNHALREIAELMRAKPDGVYFDDDAIEEMCRIGVRRATKAICGRRPYVSTHIKRINSVIREYDD